MSEGTLARRRRHRRGRDRRPFSCRAARSSRKRPSSSAAGAISRSPGRSRAETLAWPSPIENALDAIEARRGRAGLRAGERRSVLLRRRRDADAPLLARRDDLRPGALRLRARRRAARLEPAGLRAALAARPAARGDHSRICSRARGFSRSPGTTRRRRSSRRCSRRAAWGDRSSRSARRWAARASASATAEAQGFALDNVAALEHDRARGRRRPRRARPAARGRACPTTGSSTTGRSPSATSARSRSRRSRRGAANSCGTSARAPARSRSNGCSPTPPTARSRSRPATTARRASRATRSPSAFRRSRSSRARRRKRSRICRAPDAIFIGGGASAPGVIERARRRRCAPGGRLVVNAVTLETQAACVELARALRRRARRRSRSRMPSRSGAFPAGARRCRSCNGGWTKP